MSSTAPSKSAVEDAHEKAVDRYEVARPWINQMVGEDVTVVSFLEELPRKFVTGFRWRAIDRSKHAGRFVHQITFQAWGDRGQREIDHVLGWDPRGRRIIGAGDGKYLATAWFSGPTVEAIAIIDLTALRNLPPVTQQRLEESGLSLGRPIIGYGVGGLLAHGCVMAAYPETDYFIDGVGPEDPNQGTLL